MFSIFNVFIGYCIFLNILDRVVMIIKKFINLVDWCVDDVFFGLVSINIGFCIL